MIALNLLPRLFREQWEHKLHQFELNLWNFEIRAGQEAKKIFQHSFDLQRFNDKNSKPWKPRSAQNHRAHPILHKDGILKKSIKCKRIAVNKNGTRGALIFTDYKEFNKSTQHSGFCYAAVHNAPDYMNTRTNHMRNMPRRQFIGHSSELDKKLNELTATVLLDKFPK